MKISKMLCSATILLPLLNFACESDPLAPKGEVSGPVAAIVVDGGSQATDGCGWLVSVDSTLYSPTNLTTDFHQDGLSVVIEFKVLDERFRCGFPYEPRYTRIELETIKKD